jgi:hypothetical protein
LHIAICSVNYFPLGWLSGSLIAEIPWAALAPQLQLLQRHLIHGANPVAERQASLALVQAGK